MTITDVVFIDFDKVPHGRPPEVLRALGIEDPVLRWIGEFPPGRLSSDEVLQPIFQCHPITSNVLQVSVFLLLLFLLKANDLASLSEPLCPI